ncbi:DUF3467 domain-containing protein [Gaiella sp.]|jgi:hypothetical protein|uniref:DUF3467 domain-containing protein n=1 Tax=Gaiella sp. TaxID=2663207 RepID=UPI002E308F55|nr:DUF3467 domain-containing protein [Gaiella sp.]HEX5583730.1 DUF3467 domain-containing protein [Gaiella sp.]
MPDDADKVGIGPVDVPEHLRAHYANYLTINHTPWDFRLVFAVMKAPTPGDEAAAAQERGIRPQAVSEVIVPANLMHGLISAMQGSFGKYLDQYGPPGMDKEGPRPPDTNEEDE